MMKRLTPVLLVSVLISACGASHKPAPTAKPPASGTPAAAAAAPVAAPVAAPAAAPAVTAADVAKLKAQADANPVLAPWTGPHRGVPPWDKAKADAVPKAFELRL